MSVCLFKLKVLPTTALDRFGHIYQLIVAGEKKDENRKYKFNDRWTIMDLIL